MREIILKARMKPVTGFATAMEAIRHNQSSPRSIQASETSKQIAGKIVEDGCWEDDKVAILLSDDCGIRFDAADEIVVWELITADQFEEYRQSWASDPEVAHLIRLPRESTDRIDAMDRPAILSRMVGRRVRRIVTNEYGVYIHFERDSRHVVLHGKVGFDPEFPILEWSEDED